MEEDNKNLKDILQKRERELKLLKQVVEKNLGEKYLKTLELLFNKSEESEIRLRNAERNLETALIYSLKNIHTLEKLKILEDNKEFYSKQELKMIKKQIKREQGF